LTPKPRKPAGRLLLLALGMGIGWLGHSLLSASAAEDQAQGGQDEPPAVEVAPDDMLVSVTTAAVTSGDLPIVVAAAGVVRAAPASDHELSSRAGGRVLDTLVVPGQVVAAGDVLLRFDPLPLRAALDQARAVFVQAGNTLSDFDQSGRDRQSIELQTAAQRAASQVRLLEAQLARVQALQTDGLASDKALAEAQQAVEQARADQALAERAARAFADSSADLQRTGLVAARTAAEANLQEAERMLAEAEVRAPCAGQLVEFLARPGQKLEPGGKLGRLLAPEGRLVAFGVAASESGTLRPGARATWEDAQGTVRGGTLQRLGGVVDAGSGLLEALVAPDADVPAAPPGLGVRGEIEVRTLHDALLVPEVAVLRASDAQVVVLADAGRARVVPVTVLGRHAGLAAVEGSVRAGQRVIVSGGYNLPDGAHVSASDGETGPAPVDGRPAVPAAGQR
jgi:multidrug efflux pump subunit AcrA (membrane-fusion protein)